MNRREMFTRLGMAAAAATTVAAVRPDTHVVPDVEPVPTTWDFEAVFLADLDCSIRGIATALDKLGWASGLTPKPLLCVYPSEYHIALECASYFGGLVQVWATREIGRRVALNSRCNYLGENVDAWLVAWRGRRVGSIGA